MAGSEKMRLFVAIFPPAEVVENLAETKRALAAGLSPKAAAWTSPEKIHLTLNFLGGAERETIAVLERMLEGVCRVGKIHQLQARGLGCFQEAIAAIISLGSITNQATPSSRVELDLASNSG